MNRWCFSPPSPSALWSSSRLGNVDLACSGAVGTSWLWRTILLTMLVTVFLHEASHAIVLQANMWPWFIVLIAVVWLLQETTEVCILRYFILFIGVMNSLFSVYDIYDDVISRRVNSSDAEKLAEVCPCPCNGVGWGVIWGLISFLFLCGAMYLGLVILS